MSILRFVWDLIKGTLLYLLIVGGGLTLFLILAPLFGYSPYSDRPGPGWFGDFPAIGWHDFWANAWKMLQYGAFISILIAFGGLIAVAFILSAARLRAPLRFLQVGGGLVTGLITAYFMLGAGWYVALGIPGWIVSILLGLIVGAWLLPQRVVSKHIGA